ncbi:MAG: HU family DNA-binding protein, partial [Bacteroidaceae bacterium]|nr:HU family DNA-binding protein [Bacteroidaceae bacterium]
MANEKSTIQDLAESLAARNHCSRTKADTFLRKMLSLIKNGLNSDNFVKIKGFGTFKLVTVSSRESVDVNTGARIEIAEHQRVLFTPDASLKARVNKPFEKFETMIIDDDADLGKLDVDTENDKTEEPEEDQDSVEDIEEAEKVAKAAPEDKEEITPA